MKDFNIVKCYGVHLFNINKSLPINTVYGRIGSVVYTFIPEREKLTLHDLNGRILKGRKYVSAEAEAAHIIYSHEEEWRGGKRVMIIHTPRRLEGAPTEKKAPSELMFRCKPQGGEWHDDAADYESKWECGAKTPMSYFEHGQRTAGMEQFLPQKNSMIVDKSHGKSDRDKKPKVTLTDNIHVNRSQVDGYEYEIANTQLTPERARKYLKEHPEVKTQNSGMYKRLRKAACENYKSK